MKNYENFTVKIERLDVGDIIVRTKTKIGTICIEIKRKLDFVQSIIDGRLRQQIKNMTENFDNPVFILVKSHEALIKTEFNANAYYNALGSLGSKYRCSVYQVDTDNEAALLALAFIKHANLEPSINPPVKYKVSGQKLQTAMMTIIPLIGKDSAESVLKKWTIGELAHKCFKEPELTKEELLILHKIGNKKADSIINFMTNPNFEIE